MNTRTIAMDTETTGLYSGSGDRMIEIGCVEIVNLVKTNKFFHMYVDPQRLVGKSAYRIHGISDNFLYGRSLFKNIAKSFYEFIKDSTLVIHNANFDMNFINQELSMAGLPRIKRKYVLDTLKLVRTKFPGSSSNLNSLCKKFGISLAKRIKHGALVDAELLAMVYIQLQSAKQTKFDFSYPETKVKQVTVTKKKCNYFNRAFSIPINESRMHRDFMKIMPNSIWRKLDEC